MQPDGVRSPDGQAMTAPLDLQAIRKFAEVGNGYHVRIKASIVLALLDRIDALESVIAECGEIKNKTSALIAEQFVIPQLTIKR